MTHAARGVMRVSSWRGVTLRGVLQPVELDIGSGSKGTISLLQQLVAEREQLLQRLHDIDVQEGVRPLLWCPRCCR